MKNTASSPDLLSVHVGFPASSGADWRVIRGDCLSVLPQLPDKSANMIFADPPYNLQLKGELWRTNMTRFNGVTAKWDKFTSFAEYDAFCESWLSECRRILTDDGTLWVIGTYHNIGRVSRLMQDLKFWLLNDVIWAKDNPPPNFRGVRFTNATETLMWATKSEYATETLLWGKKNETSRYNFNRAMMKADNNDKQMRNVWSFPICNGAERLRDERGRAVHPTQKPERLLRRILQSCTKPGDVVLDPFLGSGTTLAVARQLGRNGVGIERSAKYVKIASARIKGAIRDEAAIAQEEKFHQPKPKRIPFSDLIEHGLLHVGQELYAPGRKIKAKIANQSGKIKIKGELGSIHKMGAYARNAPECNGWTFWSVKDEKGEFILIDCMRAEYRRQAAGRDKQ